VALVALHVAGQLTLRVAAACAALLRDAIARYPFLDELFDPDSVAADRGDNPQWLYTVVFTSQELWGPDADPTNKISIDAFEPYLEPV
jgi:hypothetical protein